MDETHFEQAAQHAEYKLTRLYLVLTILSLIAAIGICSVIFIRAGFSSFTLMHTIGSILIILVVGSGILHVKKKRIYNEILKEIDCPSEKSDITPFREFLNKRPMDYEFTLYLIKTQKTP